MSPKKRKIRLGALPRLHFNLKELAEGDDKHQAHRAISEHVPPIRLADSVTFTPSSFSTQPPAAADVTRRDDNNIQ